MVVQAHDWALLTRQALDCAVMLFILDHLKGTFRINFPFIAELLSIFKINATCCTFASILVL